MSRSRTHSLVQALWLVAAAGCAGQSHEAGPAVGTKAAESPNVVYNTRGMPFLRRDLWSDAEFERVLHEYSPQDGESTSAEVLAARLRGHMKTPFGYYIEQEPDLGLAEEILSGAVPAPTQPLAPVEGRNIFGSTDDRSRVTNNTSYPWTAIAMSEFGGSGTMIGASTLYTAAHVVFNTITGGFNPPEGWWCRNGSTDFDSNPCDGAGEPGDPRWRWGMEGTEVFRGPNSCASTSIPNGFIQLTSNASSFAAARWDFAVVDFSLAGCSDRFPGSATGTFGTWALTNSQINAAAPFLYGYAARVDDCPSGAVGDVGFSTNGTTISGTDCPGTGNWPGNTWRDLPTPTGANAFPFPPFTGGVIYGIGFGAGAITIGPNQTVDGVNLRDHTLSTSTIDDTIGDSGAAYYLIDNTQNCGLSSCRFVFGAVSGGNSTATAGKRLTNEVTSFIAAHSPDF